MEMILTLFNSVVFISLALLHFYWAFGGTFGMHAVIPTDSSGGKLFMPGKIATITVALGLLAFAAINIGYAGWIETGLERGIIRYAMWCIVAIFTLRTIGDFRYVGFSKRLKGSTFAKMDTLYYSPLCLMLAITHILLIWL
ncbi:DUF3995 domain-containing protein [Chitinophaga tropicalis]|uniref:DUF3995 domain-containing protein n=1 Tax=Chitinophaga tropicalis TaxID=2683588 RepID=A0A7K1U322_9BACT|nr:DUF3995 domain-containing protein [Chitinophaga tropicalis]MVT08748.1 DUF3995 domain-containing protein [Chitinophaga tropicalis]